MHSQTRLTYLSVVAVFAAAPLLDAKQSYGANCVSCHDTVVTNRLQVTPQSLQINLGTQLDGSVRGALDTFSVEPGGTVNISIDILNGSGSWAAVLKQFEKGGQELSQANKLVWSQTGNTGWNSYGSTTPYMATTTRSNTGAQTLTFALTVDASTPPDTYDLVMAIATKSGLQYQEAHFYLEVASAPPTQWAGYPILDQGIVDTGSWLGLIHVGTEPWVYIYDMSSYVYLPEAQVAAGNYWIFVPKP